MQRSDSSLNVTQMLNKEHNILTKCHKVHILRRKRAPPHSELHLYYVYSDNTSTHQEFSLWEEKNYVHIRLTLSYPYNQTRFKDLLLALTFLNCIYVGSLANMSYRGSSNKAYAEKYFQFCTFSEYIWTICMKVSHLQISGHICPLFNKTLQLNTWMTY